MTTRHGSLVNSLCVPVRAEASKTSQGGKLLVLRPNGEKNGISVNKESLGPSKLGEVFDDKRPSAQGQSRIEFFNSLRRKTANASAVQIQCLTLVPDSEKSAEPIPMFDYVDGMKGASIAESERLHCGNDDVFGEPVEILAIGERVADSYGVPTTVASEEEQADFMRSLGWKENGGEEALTEEEINAFYKLMKRMPSASFHLKANIFKNSL